VTAAMTLLAGQTTLWLAVGLAVGVVLFVALPILSAFAVYYAVFEDESGAVADVQRFIELRDEARRLVQRGLPLLNGEMMDAATAQIGQFQAKRDEARRALWPKRQDGHLVDSHRSGHAGVPRSPERPAHAA
jgi:hypothetical protein